MKQNFGGAAVHYAAEGEDNGVKREVATWAVADLVVGDRVKVLADQPGWVVVVLREAGGTASLLARETTGHTRRWREVILGVGQSRGLGPKGRDDLDVSAPAGLVAEGLKPASSAGGRGKGLSDDALGTLVPCHAPWLPLKADLWGAQRSSPRRRVYNRPRVRRPGCAAVGR
jgi:hypothetical protein